MVAKKKTHDKKNVVVFQSWNSDTSESSRMYKFVSLLQRGVAVVLTSDHDCQLYRRISLGL
jgi:hypothetical protein